MGILQARVERVQWRAIAVRGALILAVLCLAMEAGRSPETWLPIVSGAYVAAGMFLLACSKPRQALLAYFAALPFLPMYVGLELPLVHQLPSPRGVGLVVMSGVLAGLPGQARRSLLRSPLLWAFMPYLVELVLVQRLLLLQGSLTDAVLRTPLWLFVDALGPAVFVSVFAQDEEWRRTFLRVLFGAGTLAAVLALVESLGGTNVFLLLPLRLSENAGMSLVGWPTRFGFARAVGAVGQPSYLGWLFATLFVLSVGAHNYAWPSPTRSPWYATGILVAIVLFFGVFSTASGVPFLSMLAGIMVLVLLRPRIALQPRLGGSLGLVLVLLLMSPVGSQLRELWGSFLQLGDSLQQDSVYIQGNVDRRFSLAPMLWSVVEDSPIFGHGTLASSGAWNISRDVPNRYLIELIQGGIVGLFLWLVPIALALMRTWLAYWRGSSPGKRGLAAAALSAILVGVCALYGIGFGYQSESLFWIMVGLAWSLPWRSQIES